MEDLDPETILKYLKVGKGNERSIQIKALEELCMLLLISDDVYRSYEM